MKKRRKKAPPSKNTLKRKARLQKAKDWIDTYTGKNIVKGYSRKYHTDLLSSITELRILGVAISATYEEAIKRSIADLAEQKKKGLIEGKELNVLKDFQDEHFSFIAGYTSAGFSYGRKWERYPRLSIR